jgi:hypothetical protein
MASRLARKSMRTDSFAFIATGVRGLTAWWRIGTKVKANNTTTMARIRTEDRHCQYFPTFRSDLCAVDCTMCNGICLLTFTVNAHRPP